MKSPHLLTRFAWLFPLLALLSLGWADNWEGIRAGAKSVHTVQADFIQEKEMAILSAPLVSKGRFVFQAPDSLRWEYTGPIQSVLLMHNGKTRRHIKTDGQWMEDSAARLQSMQVVMGQITGWLHGRFDDNPDFNAELAPGPVIVLTPKEKGLAAVIGKIELALSETPGLMKSVTIYESKDSRTRLTFENSLLNADIPESVFTDIE